uniref:Uncharacterized protein n=1 Tax=Panagrolaimus superbus TaxID=310955 RepID=A0A914XXI7_9BILA
MGRSQSSLRMVYMLDFGLARQYLNAKGEIRSPRSAAGALPWRKIKDKDEVGRMKETANYEQLLEGCPQELHEIPTHLKTLGYPDDPDYQQLENILRGILTRLQIHMDDPYDWELGYENISGRSRTTTTTNGNVSTRMKSHTTAVKDRGPEEKNRALDTQAPITMGEDDDEQTGNCYRLPPMNSTHTAEKQLQHDDRQDKPKYKRQEFMRPKYGAVSFDVIDAVNARLAAATVGEKSSNNDFFNRIRYDTSIDNDKIDDGNNVDVVVDFNIRPTMIQSPSNLENPNARGAVTAPSTPLTNRAHRTPLQSQPINEQQRPSKSNRSITVSLKFAYFF